MKTKIQIIKRTSIILGIVASAITIFAFLTGIFSIKSCKPNPASIDQTLPEQVKKIPRHFDRIENSEAHLHLWNIKSIALAIMPVTIEVNTTGAGWKGGEEQLFNDILSKKEMLEASIRDDLANRFQSIGVSRTDTNVTDYDATMNGKISVYVLAKKEKILFFTQGNAAIIIDVTLIMTIGSSNTTITTYHLNASFEYPQR